MAVGQSCEKSECGLMAIGRSSGDGVGRSSGDGRPSKDAVARPSEEVVGQSGARGVSIWLFIALVAAGGLAQSSGGGGAVLLEPPPPGRVWHALVVRRRVVLSAEAVRGFEERLDRGLAHFHERTRKPRRFAALWAGLGGGVGAGAALLRATAGAPAAMFYVQTVGIMTTLAFKIFFYHVTPDFGHDIAKERGGVPAGEPLTSMVREIAAQARVTAAHDIAVYVVETDLAEAFAVALESPVVVMTRGLAVQADQVRAVIAHEIDHIHHGDSGFKMLKFSMVRGLKWTLKASFVLDAGRMVKVVGAVSWLAGELLFFAGGRSSEFAADAFAAEHASATGLVSFLSGLMDTDSEEVVLEGPLTREEHRRLHSLVAWKPKW